MLRVPSLNAGGVRMRMTHATMTFSIFRGAELVVRAKRARGMIAHLTRAIPARTLASKRRAQAFEVQTIWRRHCRRYRRFLDRSGFALLPCCLSSAECSLLPVLAIRPKLLRRTRPKKPMSLLKKTMPIPRNRKMMPSSKTWNVQISPSCQWGSIRKRLKGLKQNKMTLVSSVSSMMLPRSLKPESITSGKCWSLPPKTPRPLIMSLIFPIDILQVRGRRIPIR